MPDRRSFLASLVGVVTGWQAVTAESVPPPPKPPADPPGYEVTSYRVAETGALLAVNEEVQLVTGNVTVTTHVPLPGTTGLPEYTELVFGTVVGPAGVVAAVIAVLGDLCNMKTNRVRLGLPLTAGGRLWLTLGECVACATGFTVQAGEMTVTQDLCVKGSGVPLPVLVSD